MDQLVKLLRDRSLILEIGFIQFLVMLHVLECFQISELRIVYTILLNGQLLRQSIILLRIHCTFGDIISWGINFHIFADNWHIFLVKHHCRDHRHNVKDLLLHKEEQCFVMFANYCQLYLLRMLASSLMQLLRNSNSVLLNIPLFNLSKAILTVSTNIVFMIVLLLCFCFTNFRRGLSRLLDR